MDILIRLKIFLFLVLTCLLFSGCQREESLEESFFDNIDTMTLYDVNPSGMTNPFSPPKADCPVFQVDGQSASLIFDSLEPIGDVLWKGSCLARVRRKNGTSFHLRMSYYGGFFEILENGQIYKTQGASRRKYDAILKKAVEDVFMPARKRNKPSGVAHPEKPSEGQ